MRNNLKWESSIEFDKHQIQQKINYLESAWNIVFPQDYLDMVLDHDRALPYSKDDNGEQKIGKIRLPKVGKMTVEMISLKNMNSRGNTTTPIEIAYNALKEALTANIFLITQNGNGDKHLFDYRQDKQSPSIVFIDHEDLITIDWLSEEQLRQKSLEEWQSEKLYLVCNSFSKFLDLIDPADD